MAVRIGVIGAGDFGELHLKILAAHPEAEIAWICVRTPSRTREMAQKYGGKPTGSYEDILKDDTVDAISILTPEQVHYEQVMAALEHGKDVLVEKPVTTDPEEAEKIAAKAAQTGRIVLPAHVCRFIPEYAKVRQYLSEGEGKQPVSVFARRNIPRNRLPLHNRIHPVLMALSHDIDLIISYVKSDPLRVYALERKTEPHLENPDLFWGLIEFSNGCLAALETLWVLPTDARYVDASMEIATKDEVIHVSYPGGGIWIDHHTGYQFPDPGIVDYINGEWIGALRYEIDYFINCVKRQEKPTIVTLEEAIMGIKLARSLIESAGGKGEILLTGD